MSEDVEKYNPHHDERGRFTSGGGGGASGGGAKGNKLTPAQDKEHNQLAIDVFNHKQSMPMSVRTGKKGPAATAYRQKFSDIVDRAATITGTSAKEAYAELNRRMGA